MSMLPFEQKLMFELPNEYKNDIIYCERALRTHLKVYKIFIEKHYNSFPTSCRLYLETQINDINLEQELLFIAVRVINHDFFMALSRAHNGVNHFTINHYISQQVVSFIENEDYAVVPTHIRERLTEQQLLERFCMADKGGNTTISPSPSIAMALEPPPPRVDLFQSLLNAMSEKTVTRSVAKATIPDEEIHQASPEMPAILPEKPMITEVVIIAAPASNTKPVSKANKAPSPKTISAEAVKAHLPVIAVPVAVTAAPKSNTKPVLKVNKAPSPKVPAQALLPIVPAAVIAAPNSNAKVVSKVIKKASPPKTVSVEAVKAHLPVFAAANKPVHVAVIAAPKSNTKPVSKVNKAPSPKTVSTEAVKAHLPVIAGAIKPVPVAVTAAPKSNTKPVLKVNKAPSPKEAAQALLPIVPAAVIAAPNSNAKLVSKVVKKAPPPNTEADKAHLPVIAGAIKPVPVALIAAPNSTTKPVSKINKAPSPKEAAQALLPIVPAAVIAAPNSNAKLVSKAAKKAPPPKRVSKSNPTPSENSESVRTPSPPHLDTKTKPDDYDQNTFLGLFGLCAIDQIQLMLQRRSKRQRRTVYTNEKSDFHYGPIDDMVSSQTNAKKRKRESVPSRQGNSNSGKRRCVEVDRSQSSSPDDKALCK